LLFPNPNKTQIFKPKSDLKSTLSNLNSFKLQISIEEKPYGREIHGFMRTDWGEEEQKFQEERVEQSIREERE
jgi:hypothetical protein